MTEDQGIVDFLRDLIAKKDQRIKELELEISRMLAVFELDRQLSVSSQTETLELDGTTSDLTMRAMHGKHQDS